MNYKICFFFQLFYETCAPFFSMKKLTLFIAALVGATMAAAQGFQTVLPGLTGQELIDSLAARYRPQTVLDYANSRDTLYARILSANDDSLRCIYSGHTLYLDPNQDPTQYIYQNGGTNGMNTEHSYPVAKGATQGTNAHSDMHHLYPTRILVNEARGDKPFRDIPDNLTQKWFLNNQTMSSIPDQNRDAYAESTADAFEPRESSKGEIARSVFYLYTVYRNQANAADPNFFEIQRLTLCQWDAQDPADDAELQKTWKIAVYQDGKPNPYVLDCTLARRSWCPDVASSCQSGVGQPAAEPELDATILGTPGESVWLQVTLPGAGDLRWRVFTSMGHLVDESEIRDLPEGIHVLPLKPNDTPGIQFLEIMYSDRSGQVRRRTLPVLR
jgi:hypothetical protein